MENVIKIVYFSALTNLGVKCFQNVFDKQFYQGMKTDLISENIKMSTPL